MNKKYITFLKSEVFKKYYVTNNETKLSNLEHLLTSIRRYQAFWCKVIWQLFVFYHSLAQEVAQDKLTVLFSKDPIGGCSTRSSQATNQIVDLRCKNHRKLRLFCKY